MIVVNNLARKLFLIFFSILAIGLILYKNQPHTSEQPSTLHIINYVDETKKPNNNQLTNDISGDVVAAQTIKKDDENYKVRKNAAKMVEVRRWAESRGNYTFYGFDEPDDYKNYNKQTLEKLSESGDIHAMHTLAEEQETISAANKILRQAAVYGSTYAIVLIGSSLETEHHFSEKTAEERKNLEMEALAYYAAARLRGDQWGEIAEANSILNRFPMRLSEGDKAQIEANAQKIYSDFQQQRYQLGLGDFDNYVPDAVNEFFDEMRRDTKSTYKLSN